MINNRDRNCATFRQNNQVISRVKVEKLKGHDILSDMRRNKVLFTMNGTLIWHCKSCDEPGIEPKADRLYRWPPRSQFIKQTLLFATLLEKRPFVQLQANASFAKDFNKKLFIGFFSSCGQCFKTLFGGNLDFPKIN